MSESGTVSSSASDSGANAASVRTLAVVVDPSGTSVTWVNDAVFDYIAERGGSRELASQLNETIPIAAAIDLEDMVGRVARTGSPEHATRAILTTVRGSATAVVSVYRLPSGDVLVLAENSWTSEQRAPRSESKRRSSSA